MSVESLPYSYKTINWLATAADARKSYGVYVSESIKHLQAVPPADIVCFILRDGTALVLDAQAPVYTVSESWFNRIKLTKRSQGVLAIIRQPTWSAEAEYTHWVVCDTIQNPGNLGAIIRSVSAFLPSALVVCCGQSDLQAGSSTRPRWRHRRTLRPRLPRPLPVLTPHPAPAAPP